MFNSLLVFEDPTEFERQVQEPLASERLQNPFPIFGNFNEFFDDDDGQSYTRKPSSIFDNMGELDMAMNDIKSGVFDLMAHDEDLRVRGKPGE